MFGLVARSVSLPSLHVSVTKPTANLPSSRNFIHLPGLEFVPDSCRQCSLRVTGITPTNGKQTSPRRFLRPGKMAEYRSDEWRGTESDHLVLSVLSFFHRNMEQNFVSDLIFIIFYDFIYKWHVTAHLQSLLPTSGPRSTVWESLI